jgi:ABC-type sugar transport system ATPase subunit
MVYVTHDQVEALTLGDRIVVMEGGRIQQIGSPMEVYQRPANRFVASFVGTPAMNFLDGVIELVDGDWQFRRGPWSLGLRDVPIVEMLTELDELPATLGVRPEDVRIDAEPGPERLSAVVDLVEMLGDATVVKLQVKVASASPDKEYDPDHDEHVDVLSKGDPTAPWQPGQAVYVSFDKRKLHIFDRDTEESLLVSA